MTCGWVCLLYHDVSESRPGLSGGKQHFSVSLRAFESELELIRSQQLGGYSIADVLRRHEAKVAISFDDGDLGQYTRAFPALARRGMTATFFITTSWVGTTGYASWPQLREMKAAGMSIQSHTHTHPFLSELPAERLREELRRSKQALDDALGQDTDTLAFPGGDSPARALRPLLAEVGYRVIATSRWGINHWADTGAAASWVRRCTVRDDPDAAWFERVIRGDPLVGGTRIVRESLLHRLRVTLGPTRYARWRSRFFSLLKRF